jgi:exopolysaccharide biosynthesis polyprenyl glycosylphosphotransferase
VIGQLFIIENPVAVDRVGRLEETLVFVATLPAWVLLARAYGLYERDEEQASYSSVDDTWGVLNMVTLGTWFLVAGTWLTGIADPNFRKLLAFWVSAIVLVSGGRIVARALVRRTAAYVQNTLIIGAGSVGQLIAKKLLQHPEYGLNIVGFVDDNPTERRSDIGDLAVIGGMRSIALCVELLDVERVIVAFSGDSHETTLETLRELETLDVQIDLVPRLFEGVPPESHFHSAEGLTLIALPRARLSQTSLMLKRSLDIVGSLAGLVLLSPLLIAVGIAVVLDSRGPILFRQTRMGRNGDTFKIVKFRTMAVDADARKHEIAHLNKHSHPNGDPRMFKVHDDPRITKVGRVLRRTSIDELPQLWNVLVGQMSLVGPRPLILDEHAHVGGWGLKRLELKPGITGLWQVLGRDDIPFNEMIEFDYRYVTGWSLWNDVKLMFRTIPVLLRRRQLG